MFLYQYQEVMLYKMIYFVMMQQIMITEANAALFGMHLRFEGLIYISVISSCSATFYRLCQYHKAMEK